MTVGKKRTEATVIDPTEPQEPDMPLRLAWMTPEELADNPANWRRHPSEQVSALNAAVGQVGWAGAALYNERTSRLIDGHCRKKINPEHLVDGKLPVLIGNWSEDQERTILLTLDPLAGLAETDSAALESLMRDVQIADEALAKMVENMAEEAGIIPPEETTTPVDVEPQLDRAEELQRQWQTAPGQLWEIVGKSGIVHRLLCGDSTKPEDVARLMGGESFAVLATDPPYGIDHPTEYKDRNRGKLATCRNYPRVAGDDVPFDPSPLLAHGKPAILWGGNYFASRLPDSSGWLVWDKDRPDDLDQATCELAWTNCVKGVRRMRYLWNGMMREGDEDLVHPTQKPVAVVQWSLSLRWIPDGIVYDSFLGSGTTLIAAENLGRRCFGLEISPAYCAVILQRCLDAGMQPRLLSSSDQES